MALNFLLSFAYHARTPLAAVRSRLRCGSIMVDSGAFTAHTLGRTITLGAYAAYLERWAGMWDHAITLDKIGDPAQTRLNTRRLHHRGLPVLPVFTRGESLAEFDAMVRDHRYVAVGGLVGGGIRVGAAGVAPLIDRLGMLQRRAARHGGGIHALGVGSMKILHAVRPYSADTSTATSVTAYGNVLVYDGRMLRQVHVTQARDLTRWRDVLTGHGLDTARLFRERRIRDAPTLREAHAVAYACADEVLGAHAVTPLREGWRPGTVLYVAPDSMSTTNRWLTVDGRLHDGTAPPVWRARHGVRHVCADVAAAAR